jgi:hypothetical protein
MLAGPTVEQARGLSSTGVGTAEMRVRRERRRRIWCGRENDMVVTEEKCLDSADKKNSFEVLNESAS